MFSDFCLIEETKCDVTGPPETFTGALPLRVRPIGARVQMEHRLDHCEHPEELMQLI